MQVAHFYSLPLSHNMIRFGELCVYFYLEGMSLHKYCIAKRALMWEVYCMH